MHPYYGHTQKKKRKREKPVKRKNAGVLGETMQESRNVESSELECLDSLLEVIRLRSEHSQ